MPKREKEFPKFREPELEKVWEKAESARRKMRKIKIPGENE